MQNIVLISSMRIATKHDFDAVFQKSATEIRSVSSFQLIFIYCVLIYRLSQSSKISIWGLSELKIIHITM